MFDDFESEYWKEIFSHLLHKNMVRLNAEKLTFDNAAQVIDGFKNRHAELNPDVNYYQNYVTFELFITPTVKLRLYIQNQVKGSLLQFDEGDYVKIVDAKFPYNPFPEIEEFLSHLDEYLTELNLKINKTVHTKKQIKIAQEFIKANLIKKFKNSPEIIWTLEPKDQNFVLKITENGNTIFHQISSDSFVKEIEKL